MREIVVQKADEILAPSDELGGLYLGNMGAANALHTAVGSHQVAIVRCVNTARGGLSKMHSDDRLFCSLTEVDLGDPSKQADLLKLFDNAFSFIETKRKEGKDVLVHCRAGMHRSPAFVVAYLMKKYGLTFKEASEIITSKRSTADFKFSEALLNAYQANLKITDQLETRVKKAHVARHHNSPQQPMVVISSKKSFPVGKVILVMTMVLAALVLFAYLALPAITTATWAVAIFKGLSWLSATTHLTGQIAAIVDIAFNIAAGFVISCIVSGVGYIINLSLPAEVQPEPESAVNPRTKSTLEQTVAPPARQVTQSEWGMLRNPMSDIFAGSIFTHLPTSTLRAAGCVSKAWNRAVKSTPAFRKIVREFWLKPDRDRGLVSPSSELVCGPNLLEYNPVSSGEILAKRFSIPPMQGIRNPLNPYFEHEYETLPLKILPSLTSLETIQLPVLPGMLGHKQLRLADDYITSMVHIGEGKIICAASQGSLFLVDVNDLQAGVKTLVKGEPRSTINKLLKRGNDIFTLGCEGIKHWQLTRDLQLSFNSHWSDPERQYNDFVLAREGKYLIAINAYHLLRVDLDEGTQVKHPHHHNKVSHDNGFTPNAMITSLTDEVVFIYSNKGSKYYYHITEQRPIEIPYHKKLCSNGYNLSSLTRLSDGRLLEKRTNQVAYFHSTDSLLSPDPQGYRGLGIPIGREIHTSSNESDDGLSTQVVGRRSHVASFHKKELRVFDADTLNCVGLLMDLEFMQREVAVSDKVKLRQKPMLYLPDGRLVVAIFFSEFCAEGSVNRKTSSLFVFDRITPPVYRMDRETFQLPSATLDIKSTYVPVQTKFYNIELRLDDHCENFQNFLEHFLRTIILNRLCRKRTSVNRLEINDSRTKLTIKEVREEVLDVYLDFFQDFWQRFAKEDSTLTVVEPQAPKSNCPT